MSANAAGAPVHSVPVPRAKPTSKTGIVTQLALESARLGERLAESKPMLPYLAGKRDVRDADIEVLKHASVR